VIICEPVSFGEPQSKEGEADSVARSILPDQTQRPPDGAPEPPAAMLRTLLPVFVGGRKRQPEQVDCAGRESS
jgi:hypothetical protein